MQARVIKGSALIVLVMTCTSLIAQQFSDATSNAGITHRFVPYQGTFGGGAVVFDINNDGLEDIYLAGGMEDDRLYLNLGDGSFRDIFEGSGLENTRNYVTQAGIAADINRDGYRDLYITTVTTRKEQRQVPRAVNLLFLNDGNGKFQEATREFKLDRYQTFSTGAAFGDINNDGYADLFVANYFKEYAGDMNIMNDALIVASGQSEKCQLFINRKGRYFEEVSDEWGLRHKAFGFGGMFTDFDNDGDADLIVINDFGYKATPILLYENKYPDEKFSEVSELRNMHLTINGMGVAAADCNNDGLLDYFFTNIRRNQFLMSDSGKPFRNVSEKIGTYLPAITDSTGKHMLITWGCNFADFDQDGDEDLYVVSGSLNATVEANPDNYFENTGRSFINRTADRGIDNAGIGRGSVVFDYDRDGDLDLLVVSQQPSYNGLGNIASTTRLYRNDFSKGNWLQVKLRGLKAEPEGIGAKVMVVCGSRRMIREIDGGSGHLSQNSTITHFGLGEAARADSVIVLWPRGDRQYLCNVSSNQLILMAEKPWRSNLAYSTLWIIVSGAVLFFTVYFIFKKITRNYA